ncbi:hypothetical protein G8A07_09855 [Roseateles sp. DAIF2]|uniref:hypothetical protein n=1 Tax=Roseateles sp. DAIF2 TaxID=2714952 RepID=UPI0018A320F3|nr:hypothetical protein [Roseateles sp. DAIF2]QPF73192.1 hypothetical protein G8A07_09855 [Roseateles sp. DAIF2]
MDPRLPIRSLDDTVILARQLPAMHEFSPRWMLEMYAEIAPPAQDPTPDAAGP